MKIIRSLHDIYDSQFEIYELLRSKVDTLLESKVEKSWHYESRIKTVESYAQKIEIGRFNPFALEDYFACMIVVPNLNEVNKAIELIEDYFSVVNRKPPSDDMTHKKPEAFPFDDLRLNVKFKPDEKLPPSEFEEIVFEVQVKTFLQHAWSIATHDLIYKSDDVSWAKQRIAYQAKALLESAETTISSSEELASSPNTNIAKNNKRTVELSESIEFIKKKWLPISLPKDILRLATILTDLRNSSGLTIKDLENSLDRETKVKRGIKTLNLPPYLIIIQSLINTENPKFKKYLTRTDSKKRSQIKILLPAEINIPATYPAIVEKNVVRC